MKTEQLVEQLRKAMPAGLRSVVLYGSAATGDHVAGKSDYNVLVVADKLGAKDLAALAPAAAKWAAAGNRPPMCFTSDDLARSADTFPIELLDMQQWHTVLFGEDPLAGLRVNREHLSLELERELRGGLLQLRERYLAARGDPKAVARMLVASLSTFLVLFRATLRLYRPDVPANKIEALKQLAALIGFDPRPFLAVQDVKEGRLSRRAAAAQELFPAYLGCVEQIVAAVDRRVRSKG